MREHPGHAATVDTWLAGRAQACADEQLVGLFNEASTALWVHSRTTLGEVTLTAIAERVVLVAVERHPSLSDLTVDATMGIHWPQSRVSATAPGRELVPAFRFVLVELLTVLGNLTADILTDELHTALLEVAGPARPSEPVRDTSPGRGPRNTAAKRPAGGKKRRS